MAKKGDLILVSPGFNYTQLKAPVADQVQSATERIRTKLKKTLDDLIDIGADLQKVKHVLDHGQFGPWLHAEFGWTDRMARNFMAVAERFGKSEIISDLHIQPTAAYLLAAPSAPEEVRQVAVDRANSGEQITTKVAKEILAKARKRLKRRAKPLSVEKIAQRLRNTLECHWEQWSPKDQAEFVRQLREFVDKLDRDRKKRGPS